MKTNEQNKKYVKSKSANESAKLATGTTQSNETQSEKAHS